GAQPGGSYLLDRCLADVHQMDVVAVVDFKITRLHRHPLHAEAVIAGDQLFRDGRILDPPTNPLGDILGELGVRFLIRKYLAEVAQPDGKPRACIEPIPQRQPRFARDLVEPTTVRLMLEAAWRTSTGRKDLVISRADVSHLRIGDWPVVQGSRPVGPALEYGQIADLVGDLRNNLNARGAGANHSDLLTRHLHRFVRPVERMERTALEFLHTLEPRRSGYRKEADCHNCELACQLTTIFDLQPPQIICLVEAHRLDLAIELHVFAQIELVRDVVQVAQV